MVAINFNAAGVKPNAALEAIPTGMYPVVITGSQEKPTKAGTGSYIEFEMQIQNHPSVDPAYHGRKVFDRLNINNPNQQAVDIAYATLSAICHVTGVLQMTDTQQLHGRPFVAVVQKKPRDDQPDQMTNEVKGYKDMNGNDPGFSGNQGGGNGGGGQPGWANGNNNPAQQQNNQQVQQQPQNTQQPQQGQDQGNNGGGAPSWAGNQPQQQQPQVDNTQQNNQQGNNQPQQQNNGGAPSWAQPK